MKADQSYSAPPFLLRMRFLEWLSTEKLQVPAMAQQPKRCLCTQKWKESRSQRTRWITTDTDAWSLKSMTCWHSGTFSGTFLSILFCFYSFVWENVLRNFFKKINCLNVKYKLWLILNNVCVLTNSLTLKSIFCLTTCLKQNKKLSYSSLQTMKAINTVNYCFMWDNILMLTEATELENKLPLGTILTPLF